jgi:hypothetical protein
LLAPLAGESVWDGVLEAEPDERPVLAGEALDRALRSVASFADLKSFYTVGRHVPWPGRLDGHARGLHGGLLQHPARGRGPDRVRRRHGRRAARQRRAHRVDPDARRGGLPATGKTLVWESVDVIRVSGDQIITWHTYHSPSSAAASTSHLALPARRI